MASASDFPARGKVVSVMDGKVVFAPSNTNYQLHLSVASPYTGPVGQLVDGLIRVKARKVYTVPSGGGFISPIFGPPRTLQGWALYVDDTTVVIRAGAPIVIELPAADDALDLEEGAIRVGAIVNVAATPSVSFQLVSAGLAKSSV
jgi:hypothetical protein